MQPVVAEHPEAVSETGPVEVLICSYGWDCETALRVFKCENGYNDYGYWRPDVVSASGDYGITQINADTWVSVFTDFWENDNWADPAWNIARAYRVYLAAGGSFSPWACWR